MYIRLCTTDKTYHSSKTFKHHTTDAHTSTNTTFFYQTFNCALLISMICGFFYIFYIAIVVDVLVMVDIVMARLV